MQEIGNYVFDSNRLLFIRKDVLSENKNRIIELFPTSDNYTELMSHLEKYDKYKMTAKNKPINQIGISLTYNCNLRCSYCSYSSHSGNNDLLTVHDILSFVNEAIKSKKIHNSISQRNNNQLRFFFTGGGEPTYNWELFYDVVMAIKKRCQKYSIEPYFELTTNGMMNPEQQNFVRNNFDKVMVSYDGVSSLQNQNRKCANGHISSDIVENTIRCLVNDGMPVTIRSTVWHKDFCKLKKIYDNIADSFPNINEWSIMPILPAGRALNIINEDEYRIIKGQTFFDYYIELYKYSLDHITKIYVSSPLFVNSIADYCCGATFNECFWIMPDKTINNCIEAEMFRNDVGCIDNGKVLLYDYYYDSHLDEVKNNFVKCRDCIAYRFCKGGCPLKSIRDSEFKTNYKQYECDMIKQYWRYVFGEILSGRECFGWKTEPVEIDKLDIGAVYRLIGNN